MTKCMTQVFVVVALVSGIALLVVTPPARAGFPFPRPQASVIAGEVLDTNGDPVEGITVTLVRNGPGGGTQTTTTDEDGFFVFKNLSPGSYTVSVCGGVGEGSSITVSLAGPDYFVTLTAGCA